MSIHHSPDQKVSQKNETSTEKPELTMPRRDQQIVRERLNIQASMNPAGPAPKTTLAYGRSISEAGFETPVNNENPTSRQNLPKKDQCDALVRANCAKA